MMNSVLWHCCLTGLLLGALPGCQTASRTVQVDPNPRSVRAGVELAAASDNSDSNTLLAAVDSGAEVNSGSSDVNGPPAVKQAPVSEAPTPSGGELWSSWPKNPLSQLIPATIRRSEGAEPNKIAGREAF
ncbi:hypothetical protein Pla110_11800 [Polystyrenella longa]|uniref:Uncharacterized protein n=1 Tax=Polystyrenella longa TaxID=2528007 RepID=A0A518CJS4_9PLAN|nr:hypothetical protein [Polystyrenella longa]QDU79470.1 hypothetical protein Pla110_11800 [Polystyrenella longa]